MLVAFNSLVVQQNKATHVTAKQIAHFLNYCATHPNACIEYHHSNMILHIHSDASYLSEPGARNKVGGYSFLGLHPN